MAEIEHIMGWRAEEFAVQLRHAGDEWPEWKAACGNVIQAARKLRPKMMQRDLNAFDEFGRIAGTEFAMAGATAEEAEHYTKRILLMVLAEHQA